MVIYLDNSATTFPYPEVIDVYHKALHDYYGNPSSLHRIGSEADQVLQGARKVIANLLQVLPEEIIFTSGGTEGNNMAIQGVAHQYKSRGKHIITSQIEHASVLHTCQHLERLGFDVTYLPVNADGVVSVEDVKDAMRPDTILVSIMHVNSEIGSIQPIREIGALLAQYPKVIFHVDAVQSIAKLPVKPKEWGIDLLTISGHKFHGPKGTGALYKAKHIQLQPVVFGGGQEFGYRSGTQNVPGIIAFTKAFRISMERQSHFQQSVGELRQYLWRKLAGINRIVINSPREGAPHILNISVMGIKPEVMLHALEKRGVMVSTRSACSSKEEKISHVLQALHLPYERAASALRLSLSSFNTKEEMDRTVEAIQDCIRELTI